ncbi:MAG: Ku protein [Deltaproteobacteria bacterium]|nr:Ku protein [Deltaproteobacteria bacterium]
MPARAIGSATISFGLVSIPVKLYSATESTAAISFNWLHKKCGSRVKQQYVCPRDDEAVSRDDLVKGYEFAKDRYVTFTPEELKALEQESTQAIEITEFVPPARIDPIYFDKPYYLGPDKGGDKAYRLLGKAMLETERAALGRYASHGKQYLVLLRPLGDGLVLQQLHYADEVRAMADVPMAAAEVKEGELKLAVQLVEQISSDAFRPEVYEDEVRRRVRELVQKKVEGEEISAAPPQAAPGARIIDLMEALKASLAPKAPAAAERKPAKRAARAVSSGKPAREKSPKTARA